MELKRSRHRDQDSDSSGSDESGSANGIGGENQERSVSETSEYQTADEMELDDASPDSDSSGSDESGSANGIGGENQERSVSETSETSDGFHETRAQPKRSRTSPPHENLIGHDDLFFDKTRMWHNVNSTLRCLYALNDPYEHFTEWKDIISLILDQNPWIGSLNVEDSTKFVGLLFSMARKAVGSKKFRSTDTWKYQNQAQLEMFENNRKDITVALMENYPQLLRKFMADEVLLPYVAALIRFMKIELYSLKRQEQSFKAVVGLIKDAVFKHGEEKTIRSCVKAMVFCASESKGELRGFSIWELNALQDELLYELTTAIKEVKNGNDEDSLLVNLKRCYELQWFKPVLAASTGLYAEIALMLHIFRNLDEEVISLMLSNMHRSVMWSLQRFSKCAFVFQSSLSNLISKRDILFEELSYLLNGVEESRKYCNKLALMICAILAEEWYSFGPFISRVSTFDSLDSHELGMLGYCPDSVLIKKYWKLCEEILNTSDETDKGDENKKYARKSAIYACNLVTKDVVPKDYLVPEIISHLFMHGPSVTEIIKDLITWLREKEDDLSNIYLESLKRDYQRYASELSCDSGESRADKYLEVCRELAGWLSGMYIDAACKKSRWEILSVVNKGVEFSFRDAPKQLLFLEVAILPFATRLSVPDIIYIKREVQGHIVHVNKDEDPSGWRPCFTFLEALEEKCLKDEGLQDDKEGAATDRVTARDEHLDTKNQIPKIVVGVGLNNLGNSCFVNSVLQCLTHTVALIESLRSYKYQDLCNCGNVKFCVIRALRDHIKAALTSRDSISPHEFVDNLNYFSPFFLRFEDEDVHEFLQLFLEKLWICCSDQTRDISSEDVNIVDHVFSGSLINKIRCCKCNSVSETLECCTGLTLPVEGVDDLQGALNSFTRGEKLEEQSTCDKCKGKTSKEKHLLLGKVPPVATFLLKRFKTNRGIQEKISNPIKIPLELNTQPYMKNKVSTKYHLYAFVEHIGETLKKGHYISYVRSGPKTWHRFNDDQVKRVEEDCLQTKDSYLLFYAREGTPWFEELQPIHEASFMNSMDNNSPTDRLEPDGDKEVAATDRVTAARDAARDEHLETKNQEPKIFVGSGLTNLGNCMDNNSLTYRLEPDEKNFQQKDFAPVTIVDYGCNISFVRKHILREEKVLEKINKAGKENVEKSEKQKFAEAWYEHFKKHTERVQRPLSSAGTPLLYVIKKRSRVSRFARYFTPQKR